MPALAYLFEPTVNFIKRQLKSMPSTSTSTHEQIVQLIQQIPPEYASLTLALTDLVNRYRFDRIVELTQPQA